MTTWTPTLASPLSTSEMADARGTACGASSAVIICMTGSSTETDLVPRANTTMARIKAAESSTMSSMRPTVQKGNNLGLCAFTNPGFASGYIAMSCGLLAGSRLPACAVTCCFEAPLSPSDGGGLSTMFTVLPNDPCHSSNRGNADTATC